MKNKFTFKVITSLILMFISFNKLQAQTCNAWFSYTINPNGVAVFTDSSWAANQITYYIWNFGDGSGLGTTPVMTHTYSASGVYNVCLIVGNAGCSDTICQAVMVNIGSGCNMTVAVNYSAPNLSLYPTITGGTQPFTYLWSTGETTQMINPIVAGNYCVDVVDAMGCTATACYTWQSGCNYNFTQSWLSAGQLMFITTGTTGITTVWDFGDGSPLDSTQTNQISHTYMIAGNYNVCMMVQGCNTVCNNVYSQGFPTAVLCGNVFNDNNGNSIIDSLDTGLAGGYLYIFGNGVQQTILTDSLGNYSFGVPAGTYTIQMCPSGISLNGIFTVPGSSASVPPTSCASYTVTIAANDTICGNNFGIFSNASTVSGYLFFDANNNGVMDGNETGLAYQPIMIGTYNTYTNSQGYYSLMVPIGTYVITYTPSGFYASGTITTANVTVNVTQNGVSYSNNNIGLYMTPGQVDLGINISPNSTIAPGFPAYYSMQVCNYGTTPVGATVTMQYDPVLTPNNQSPIAATVDLVNHLITWNIPNINPGSCSYFWLNFTAAVGTPLGTSTFEFVNVTPLIGIDNNLTNNMDTMHQMVTGSWDPNNKLVTHTNTLDEAYQLVDVINPNQEIKYTINFQNSGTAPAVNVVVIDEMSSNLDINSYQFISSSHNCTILRNGNTTTYKFMNIMLPDSTNNEPQSHGSISFKINALNGLNIGDQIIDNANIYFDFNDAVTTNDAKVTMVGPTAIPALISTPQLTVYPNPASDFVSVNLQSKTEGTASLNMIDATGKLCFKQDRELKAGINKLILSTNQLSKGMYLLQVITPDGIVKTNKISIVK